MNEVITEIHKLTQEIAGLLSSGAKTDARKAVVKLQRIAALASTSALTIELRAVR